MVPSRLGRAGVASVADELEVAFAVVVVVIRVRLFEFREDELERAGLVDGVLGCVSSALC